MTATNSTTCAHCAQTIHPTRANTWTTSYAWRDAQFCPGTIRFHQPVAAVNGLPRHIEEAVYTAVSEIPDAHPDDIADCVYGMIGAADYDANEAGIVARIASLR